MKGITMKTTSSIMQPSNFLKSALLADAIVSGATGLLLFLGAEFLAGLLQLPETLLRPAGLFLLPYAALVAFLATRVNPPTWAVWAIILTNTLWAIESIVLLFGGSVTPNVLGYTFVIAQALVVAGFAGAQFVGLQERQKVVA